MAEVPKTLGRYEIEAELGRGMMGVVYAAKDPALGRGVALKTVNVVFAISETERGVFEQRFLSEARLAAGLSHPNIVVVHDVGRDDATGTPFIAFEYLKGVPLSERVPPPLDWREALRITGSLADALHHAHLHGIVHRDIKPGNVMLLSNGTPKLMDFGVARAPASNLTMAGEFFGTPSYMSPEQAAGERVDGRSDLFSLGAVLYYLLSGRRAFDGKTVPAILAKLEREQPPELAGLVPGLPPSVTAIVGRLLAKRPGDRYQDGSELAADIEDVLEGRTPRHAVTLQATAPQASPGQPEELTLALPDVTPAPQAAAAAASELSGHGAATTEAARAQPPAAATATGAAGVRLPGAAVLAIAGLLLVAAVAVVWPPRAAAPLRPPDTQAGAAGGTPAGGTGTAGDEAAAAPAARLDPASEPARLTIAVEHGVRQGTLSVLVDRQKLVARPLTSQETKKALVFKGRKGRLVEVIDIPAGDHAIRVEVREGGELKAGQVWASFGKGEARLLEVKVGSSIELEWR